MPTRFVVGTPAAPPAKLTGLDVDLNISYRGMDGKVTDRLLTLHQADGHMEGEAFVMDDLRGYCHFRRMARTFRFDRIVRAADADGVVIPDLAHWILEKAAPR